MQSIMVWVCEFVHGASLVFEWMCLGGGCVGCVQKCRVHGVECDAFPACLHGPHMPNHGPPPWHPPRFGPVLSHGGLCCHQLLLVEELHPINPLECWGGGPRHNRNIPEKIPP